MVILSEQAVHNYENAYDVILNLFQNLVFSTCYIYIDPETSSG
jgi:hypothetical protein